MKKQKKSKLNEFIQHAIDCESYGNNTAETVTELLQYLFEQIIKILKTSPYVFSKGVYNQLLKDIEAVLEEYRKNVTSVYELDIKDIASYQSNWMKDFLSDLGKAAIIPASILSTLKFNPVANASNYKDLVDNSVYKIRQSVESSLRTAYITQEEMTNVTARFEHRKPQFEKNIIADTKVVTATAFSAVNYLMYRTNRTKVVYCAILDSKTCIPCAELNGKEYDYKDQPILPSHWNCVVGDSLVSSGSRVSNYYTRWYQGPVYRIVDSCGNVLTITPKHPVLTDRGFISAELLKCGDNLVLDTISKRDYIASVNKNNKKTTIEEVFSSFDKSAFMQSITVPLSSKDFHGDVIDHKVGIVWTNRNFLIVFISMILKNLSKIPFVNRMFSRLTFVFRLCGKTFFFKGPHSSFCSFISSLNIFFNNIRRSIVHSSFLLLRCVSHVYIIFSKYTNHLRSFYIKMFCNSSNANSFVVKFQNLIKWNIRQWRCDRSRKIQFSNKLINLFNCDIKLSRKFFARHFGKIKFSKIVSIDVIDFSGQVYNLQTKTNYYTVNNVIVHNCRCSVLPKEALNNSEMPESFEQWFESLSEEEKIEAVGPERYKLYQAGIPVTKFVDNQNKQIPIKELKESIKDE